MNHSHWAASLLLSGFALLPAVQGEAQDGPGKGRIVGTARRAADGTAIPKGQVLLADRDGRHKGGVNVRDGQFATGELDPGTYYAFMDATDAEVGQIYGGEPYCLVEIMPRGRCDPRSGKPIEVVAGEDAKIDFSLVGGAFLLGKVSAPPGATKKHAIVQVADHLDEVLWSRSVPLPATFRAGPFPPGRYVVHVTSEEAPRQAEGRICVDVPCFSEDVAVPLAQGEVRELAELQLQPYGALTIKALDQRTGKGIHAQLGLYSAATRQTVWSRRSYLPDGRIEVDQVPPGEYLVTMSAGRREGRAFGDVPFLPGGEAAALDKAQKVTVPAGGKLELPPLRLRQLGAIRGAVVNLARNGSLQGAEVWAYRDGKNVRQTFVDTRGEFQLTGLEPGAYQITLNGMRGQDLLVGSGEPCMPQHSVKDPLPQPCDFAGGTSFEVGFDETLDVGDIRVPAGAQLSGKLRLAPGIVGLPTLHLFTADHRQVARFTAREPTNEWEIHFGMPAGTYYLAATAPGHLTQIYLHRDCPAGSTLVACAEDSPMKLFTVAPGDERSDIFFNLTVEDAPSPPERP